ncbi:MAG TPA: ADP-ribosylglycohydrolase family protein [Fimbriimonas sp.]
MEGTLERNATLLDERYAERVYAGVLGKVIGVYLGRPFEGWPYRRILEQLGEVEYYVHDRLGAPLIVTDDDISGTFTFLRALEDYGFNPGLTPAQIGQTWLNYLVENKTVLWWGGLGMSTEHTAYLRLKHGIEAPESGSIRRNGQVVAEQIGSQIFIDGWGLINPGDPERAADFARRAASVSHDGEAIFGAQVQAALVAQAFVEPNLERMLDVAVAQIPKDSTIARMIGDIRDWHGSRDWQEGFLRIEDRYGYDRYGGGCHIVPNHGLIIHALLHGRGDFQESLKIVNTCGWDTDCNSGNVGCILGVWKGLAGLDTGPDWRGPVADRMYLPTADGGRAVTDAVQETYRIVNTARRLRGEAPLEPKGGARFHFSPPGSLQGFVSSDSTDSRGVGEAIHRDGKLEIRYRHLARGRVARIKAETFPGAGARKMGGYGVIASPTLYPGQTLRARVQASEANSLPVLVRLFVGVGDAGDEVRPHVSPAVEIQPGQYADLEWQVPSFDGYPICEVGIEATSDGSASGSLYLDFLTWDGPPEVALSRCEGELWREAWVNGVSSFWAGHVSFVLVQNEGTGLLIQGTREWMDYAVAADVEPHLAEFAGIAARVQGMRRYYALVVHRGGEVRLVKALDGDTILAAAPLAWEFGRKFDLRLEVQGSSIRGFVDGEPVLTAEDRDLVGGGIAYVLCEGRMNSQTIRISPLGDRR